MTTTTSPSSSRASTATPWAPTLRTTVFLTICGILMVGQLYTVLALLEPMSTSFGVDAETVTWTSTAFALAYAVGFLIFGPLSDRFGTRRIMTVGMAATAATTALVAAAPGMEAGVGLRALQGLTAASLAPAAFSYVAARIAPNRRPLVLTCLTSSFLASAPIMQVGAQGLARATNWQAVFLTCALLIAVVALIMPAVLRPDHTQKVGSVSAAFTAMPALLANGRLLALFAATTTLLGGYVAILTAVTIAGPPAMADDPATLLVLRASGLPVMIVVPVLMPLLTRLHPHVRIPGGLALAAVAAWSASLAGHDVLPLAATLMAFVAGILVAAPALVQAIAGIAGHRQGAATALYAFAMFVGASLGPQLAGSLAARGFAGIVQLVAVVAALGALVSLAGKKASGRANP
ncbi:MFS transporter [Actinobacteria bacterium YIM 96077]|uniref:MFS transporter n=1 Tax=Phytoactinopolyspora halophila TaxID=1981511 RepID=A0A329R3K1_9ACTN|nr:MFS transporter [Phytoactinopolyspora halophila]AYY13203.1 MFS transporter [Actinobacteria bacterium YIM 96077]RAW17558.1 MFS transporter [Phytoactinopolyspora halophila]